MVSYSLKIRSRASGSSDSAACPSDEMGPPENSMAYRNAERAFSASSSGCHSDTIWPYRQEPFLVAE